MGLLSKAKLAHEKSVKKNINNVEKVFEQKFGVVPDEVKSVVTGNYIIKADGLNIIAEPVYDHYIFYLNGMQLNTLADIYVAEKIDKR